MKVVYFGTPEIAAGCLEEILGIKDINVVCVVTRADKPKGRGYKVEFSPVKELAIKNDIPLYQPDGLRNDEAKEFLSSLGADMFITCAYGRIFPKEILDIPPMGCINIHASLLPELRGASPINRAIINGDTVGGVTVMYMDEGMDTGDIALKIQTDIPYDMDFGGYYDVMTTLGRKAINEFLVKILNGETPERIKQDDSKATYAQKVEKSETEINFNKTSGEVYNLIRGLAPAPCAYTFLAEKRVKIFNASEGNGNGEPGSILRADKNGIEIACAKGSIIIKVLQPDGKKSMAVSAFLAGNRI